MRALWAPHPIKGHAGSQVMVPWGWLKMPEGWQEGGFHRTVYMLLQRYIETTLLLTAVPPQQYVPTKIC
jgi:hypothetical protein